MSQYFDHPNLNIKCGFELLKPYEKQNKEKGNEKRKKKTERRRPFAQASRLSCPLQ